MNFYNKNKKPIINYHYTEEDKWHLAQAIESDQAKSRKFKAYFILENIDFKQDILIYVYGESKDEIKLRISEHYQYFKEKDSKWKIKETKLLKSDEFENETSNPKINN